MCAMPCDGCGRWPLRRQAGRRREGGGPPPECGGGGNIRAINVNEEGRMVELRTQNLVEILIMND